MLHYTVIIEAPAAPGECFGAYAPDVPGCITTGATAEEALAEMAAALEFHLAGLAEDGEAPPPRHSSAVEVAVRVAERREAA